MNDPSKAIKLIVREANSQNLQIFTITDAKYALDKESRIKEYREKILPGNKLQDNAKILESMRDIVIGSSKIEKSYKYYFLDIAKNSSNKKSKKKIEVFLDIDNFAKYNESVINYIKADNDPNKDEYYYFNKFLDDKNIIGINLINDKNDNSNLVNMNFEEYIEMDTSQNIGKTFTAPISLVYSDYNNIQDEYLNFQEKKVETTTVIPGFFGVGPTTHTSISVEKKKYNLQEIYSLLYSKGYAFFYEAQNPKSIYYDYFYDFKVGNSLKKVYFASSEINQQGFNDLFSSNSLDAYIQRVKGLYYVGHKENVEFRSAQFMSSDKIRYNVFILDNKKSQDSIYLLNNNQEQVDIVKLKEIFKERKLFFYESYDIAYNESYKTIRYPIFDLEKEKYIFVKFDVLQKQYKDICQFVLKNTDSINNSEQLKNLLTINKIGYEKFGEEYTKIQYLWEPSLTEDFKMKRRAYLTRENTSETFQSFVHGSYKYFNDNFVNKVGKGVVDKNYPFEDFYKIKDGAYFGPEAIVFVSQEDRFAFFDYYYKNTSTMNIIDPCLDAKNSNTGNNLANIKYLWVYDYYRAYKKTSEKWKDFITRINNKYNTNIFTQEYKSPNNEKNWFRIHAGDDAYTNMPDNNDLDALRRAVIKTYHDCNWSNYYVPLCANDLLEVNYSCSRDNTKPIIKKNFCNMCSEIQYAVALQKKGYGFYDS